MKILVTGGSGFLGSRIVERLQIEGHELRVLVRRDVAVPRAEKVFGHLGDKESLLAATKGIEAVIHTAAISGIWGPLSDYVETNTLGTFNLLQAAKASGVGFFVHTSTPSVVHSGGNLADIDEGAPYSLDIRQPYAYSKMLAERLVLGANSREMKTICLRPHLIWGPGDPHLLPRLAEKSRRGRLYIFRGGPYIVDATYIDNAVHAHVLALKALVEGRALAEGQAFFIAQGQPMDLNSLINNLLKAIGAPPAKVLIPRPVGIMAAQVCEKLWHFLALSGEPPLTVFAARQLSSSHWYNLDKAKNILGYEAQVSFEEGLRRLSE